MIKCHHGIQGYCLSGDSGLHVCSSLAELFLYSHSCGLLYCKAPAFDWFTVNIVTEQNIFIVQPPTILKVIKMKL